MKILTTMDKTKCYVGYKHLLTAEVLTQVLLITLTTASLYSSVPVRFDSAHAEAARWIGSSLTLLFTPVLFLLNEKGCSFSATHILSFLLIPLGYFIDFFSFHYR